MKGSIHIPKIKLYCLYFCSDIFYFRGNHNHVINYSSFFSAIWNHSFANFHHGIENLRCGRFLHDFLCFRVFFFILKILKILIVKKGLLVKWHPFILEKLLMNLNHCLRKVLKITPFFEEFSWSRGSKLTNNFKFNTYAVGRNQWLHFS